MIKSTLYFKLWVWSIVRISITHLSMNVKQKFFSNFSIFWIFKFEYLKFVSWDINGYFRRKWTLFLLKINDTCQTSMVWTVGRPGQCVFPPVRMFPNACQSPFPLLLDLHSISGDDRTIILFVTAYLLYPQYAYILVVSYRIAPPSPSFSSEIPPCVRGVQQYT